MRFLQSFYSGTFSLFLVILTGCLPGERAFDTMKVSLVEMQPAASAETKLAQEQLAQNKGGLQATSENLAINTSQPVSLQPLAPKASPESAKATTSETAKPESAKAGMGKTEKNTSPSPKEAPKSPGDSSKDAVEKWVEEIPEEVSSRIGIKKGNYTIENTLTITEDGILVIQAGTQITLKQSSIVCHGTIKAEGTEKEPVVFHGPDGWDNISIVGEKASGIFNYCHISDGLGIEIGINADHAVTIGKGKLPAGGALLYANHSSGVVSRCKIVRNSGKGAIALISVKEVRLDHNEIAENKDEGLWCGNGDIKIEETNITQNGKCGILFDHESKASMQKCVCSKNKLTGVIVNEKAAPSIYASTISENLAGIDYFGEEGGSLKNNIIRQNEKLAVRCMGVSKPTVEENEIENNGTIAMFLCMECKPRILRNKIVQHEKACILILDKSAPLVSDNIFGYCNVGIVIEASAKAEIQANQTSHCKQEKQTFPEGALRNLKPK